MTITNESIQLVDSISILLSQHLRDVTLIDDNNLPLNTSFHFELCSSIKKYEIKIFEDLQQVNIKIPF